MKYRGRIQPYVARRSTAHYCAAFLNRVRYVRFGDAAEAVRSWCDEKRSIGPRYRIYVNAERHHTCQHGKRRRDVQDAVFNSPRAKAIDVATVSDGDRAILMPSQRPVQRWRLVEKNRPDWPTRCSQKDGSNCAHGTGCRKQWAKTLQAMKANASLMGWRRGHQSFNCSERSSVGGAGEKLCPVPSKGHRPSVC
jgi:hypothetical protein